MVNWLLHLVAIVSQEKSAVGQQQLRQLPQQYLRSHEEPKLSKNSQQRQNHIDQQSSKISSLEAPEPEANSASGAYSFWWIQSHRAVASNLNINVGNKPQKSDKEGTSGYTQQTLFREAQTLEISLWGLMDPWIQSFPASIVKDTSHLKENCVRLNRGLALENRQPDWLPKKPEELRPPLVMDQPKGESESGPHPSNEEKSLICSVEKCFHFGRDKDGDHAT